MVYPSTYPLLVLPFDLDLSLIGLSLFYIFLLKWGAVVCIMFFSSNDSSLFRRLDPVKIYSFFGRTGFNWGKRSALLPPNSELIFFLLRLVLLFFLELFSEL